MSHRPLPSRTLVTRGLAVAFLAAGATLAGCTTTTPAGWSQYGASTAFEEPTSRVASLDGSERGITVGGTIVEVCAVKGCWMRLRSDDGDVIFVRFRDYGFFVPRDAAGRRAVLHGDAVDLIVSVEELQHLAGDGGASPEEIARITAPERRVEFLADAVWIEGVDLQPPFGAEASG